MKVEQANSARGVFAALLQFDLNAGGGVVAPPSPDKGARIYGGQYLGQGLAACQDSVDPDRVPHSLHAYFLRTGDAHQPIEYRVQATRDGRGFSSRLVAAWQAERELFQMIVSFQVPEPGRDYVRGAMPTAPDPQSVAITYNEVMVAGRPPGTTWSGAARPMDIRYVNPPNAPSGEPILEDQLTWMRIDDSTLGDDPRTHYAGIAYLSDSTLVDHVVLPHGARYQDDDLESASLDHAMWFHRPPRCDEWLLFEQGVEATGGGRGLARGRVFDRTGNLVATCMQEGLIRWR